MTLNKIICFVVFAIGLLVVVDRASSSSVRLHWPVQQRNDIVNWSPKAQLVNCRKTPTERSWPPSDYELVANLGYYKLHEFGTSWNKARQVCEEEGAHLVIVNSAAEAEALKTLMTKHQKIPEALNKDHMWVGVHERGAHGKFFTIFGDRLEDAGYLSWSKTPQQPNDPTPDDCVSFYKSGVMYDDPCDVKYGFVCEIEHSLVDTLKKSRTQYDPPTSSCNGKQCNDASTSSIYWPTVNNNNFVNWSPRAQLVDCAGVPGERTWPPSDYELVPQVGYYKLHPVGMTWHRARTVCQEEGAHLVVVNSAPESEALKKLMAKHPKMPESVNKDHVWMGLHERGTHGKFYTIFGDKLEDTGFVNWNPKQPNDPTPDDCVTFYHTGVLFDDPCNVKYGFVCEIELGAATSPAATANTDLVYDLVCNDRVCPQPDFATDQAGSQTDNIDVRGGYGGSYGGGYGGSYGGSYGGGAGGAGGGGGGGGGQGETVQQQPAIAPVSDFYWPAPGNAAISGGSWAPQARPIQCSATPAASTWPPKDYTLHTNLGYYKYYPYGTAWGLARHACEEDGAHLLIVNSEKEAVVLRGMMAKNPTSVGATVQDHVWLGAHERGVNGDFYTIFGDKLLATGFWRWADKEPNDKGLEDCVLMKPGGLADWECDKKLPFVCEIELSQVDARRKMLSSSTQENYA